MEHISNQLPVNNLISKILIGKVIKFHSNKYFFVILNVRRNVMHGYLEILVARVYENKNKNGFGRFALLYSWYCYNPKHDFYFAGRDNKKAIRNCLKKRPEYIKFHTGRHIDVNELSIHDRHSNKITFN